MSTCTNCSCELRPFAKFCGHCGSQVKRMTPVEQVDALFTPGPEPAYPLVHAPQQVAAYPMPCPVDPMLAAQLQLEQSTRLNPLMNQERIKAMIMGLAAQGSHGLVGLWSDD